MDCRVPSLSLRITTLRTLDMDSQERALRFAYTSALTMDDRQLISKVSLYCFAVCILRFLFFSAVLDPSVYTYTRVHQEHSTFFKLLSSVKMLHFGKK